MTDRQSERREPTAHFRSTCGHSRCHVRHHLPELSRYACHSHCPALHCPRVQTSRAPLHDQAAATFGFLGRVDCACLLELGNGAHNVVVVRESALLELGVDEVAVHGHFKRRPATHCRGRLDTFAFLRDQPTQSLSTGGIPSGTAVFDVH